MRLMFMNRRQVPEISHTRQRESGRYGSAESWKLNSAIDVEETAQQLQSPIIHTQLFHLERAPQQIVSED